MYKMSDSMTWEELWRVMPDAEEILDSLLKGKLNEPQEMAEINKTQVTPLGLNIPNPRSSSCQFSGQASRVQTLFTNVGYLINPLGFPYKQQMSEPVASLESCLQVGIQIGQEGKQQHIEGHEEATRKKEQRKIRKRVMAARYRAKREVSKPYIYKYIVIIKLLMNFTVYI